MRPWVSEQGQASPEYLGLVVLLAALATAFAGINAGPGIAASVQGAFCHAVGAECGDGGSAALMPSEDEVLERAIEMELADFLAMKDSEGRDARMDWSDDGCSAPTGSEGFWFHFRDACERHDFGYRNSKRLGLFDELKDRIDLAFADDMLAACAEEAWWQRRACRWMAGVYFGAVSIAGGRCEVPGELIGRVPGPCAPEHG